MTYKDLYSRTKTINISQIETLSTFYEHLFLRASFFITPFFIKCHISANAVSLFMLLICLVSVGLIVIGNSVVLSVGVFLYFFAQVLDAVDGNIARMTNTSTYFGRFLDGVIDIVALVAIQLAFAWVAFYQCHNEILMWVGVVSAVITLLHCSYYDRYSALARWINEENQTNVKPYIKKSLSPKINWLLNDLHYSCLVAMSILFGISHLLWEYTLLLFFLIHIGQGVFCIYAHTKSAYIYMRVPAPRK